MIATFFTCFISMPYYLFISYISHRYNSLKFSFFFVPEVLWHKFFTIFFLSSVAFYCNTQGFYSLASTEILKLINNYIQCTYIEEIKTANLYLKKIIYIILRRAKPLIVNKCYNLLVQILLWSYLPTPPLGQDMTHGQFLSGV